MAASLIGNLAVLLSMDTASFEKGNSHAQKLLRKTQRQFESIAKKINGVGQALSIGVTAPLVAFGTVAVREATEAAAAMGQVEAALKSMGPVAGKTAAELKKAADAFETQSLFEADEILSKVTANLLTFGNVSGDAFDRAQQAALNMSARLGQDLQSSAIQVGKALNDPIKGMTALQRVGVQFTATQRDQIKAFVDGGQAAKAQALILGELERQFGGAALAAQNTDPFNKSADAFRQMAEQVGTALLPIIPIFTDAIVKMANAFSSLSPETQKWVIIAAAAGAALGPLLIGISGLVSATGLLLPLFIKLVPAVTALSRVLLLMLGNPIILGAAVVIGGIYLAWKNWDKIVAIVTRVYNAVKSFIVDKIVPILQFLPTPLAAVISIWRNWDQIAAIVQRVYNAVKTWILDKLNAIWDSVAKKIKWIGDKFAWLYDVVVGNSYIPDMVDEIGAQMARLDAVMVAPVQAATSKAAEAFRDLQQQTKGLLDRLFPEAAELNQLRSEMALLEQAMRKGILTAGQYAAALERLQTEGLTNEPLSFLEQGSLVPANENVVDGIAASLSAIPDAAARANESLMMVAQSGINSLADGLTGVIMGTAKLGDVFREVAAQIIADLIRIQIQKLLMDTLGSALGLSGGSSFGGGLATGGPAIRGKTYLVGEKGPELFSPGVSGRVISNDNIGDMGNSAPLIGNVTLAPGMTRREGRDTGLALARAARDRLAYVARGRK
jgi:hypothetical protein